MMQLVCNGVELDLYANTNIQFKDTNPLFAFDSIKCERTTNVKIPATRTNDSVLSLARVPAYRGDGMRRRFDASMIFGLVVMKGYLYVSNFDGKDYNAVFITGEFLGLQMLKEAGNVAEYIDFDYTGEWTSNSPVLPSVGKTYPYDTIRYRNASAIKPSARLYAIIKEALDNLGVGYSLPENFARLIPNKLSGIKNQQADFYSQPNFPAIAPAVNLCATAELSGAHNVGSIITTSPTLSGVGGVLTNDGRTYYYQGQVEQLVASQEITITFPDDWNDDIFIGTFLSAPTEYVTILAFEFFGERSFNDAKVVTGESLRGRSVTIPKDTRFTFIHIDDFGDYSGSSGTGRGWFFQGGIKEFSFTVEGGDIVMGDIVRAWDNLPEMTIIDLLKTYAALTGTILYYSDTGYTNILQRLPVSYLQNGTFDINTGSLVSTRTNNTNPTSNDFRLFKLLNGSRVGSFIFYQNTVGSFSFSITKDNSFNGLDFVFNGNQSDTVLTLDVSEWNNGDTYTITGKVSVLDRTNTGNDAAVTGFCIVTGTQAVTWDEWKGNTKGVSFDELNFEQFKVIDESDHIISMKEVARKFSDYGQHNLVKYSNNDNVLEAEKIIQDYTVENANIEAEKTLQDIPFSEGNAQGVFVFVPDTDGDGFVLADAGTSFDSMIRVLLPKNVNIQNLCDESTQVKVNIHMPLLIYNQITPKTAIMINGLTYLWTERSWQKDVAQFTLAKYTAAGE